MAGKPSRERSRGTSVGGGPVFPASHADIVDYGIGSGFVEDDPAPGEGINTWTWELGSIIAAQTTGAAKPALTAGGSPNGNDVATFDGGDWLATNVGSGTFPSPLAQPYTIAVLMKQDVPGPYQYVCDGIGVNNRGAVIFPNGPARLGMHGGTFIAGANTPDADWHRLIVTFNGASSEIELDEVSFLTGNAGTHSLTGLTLGTFYARSSLHLQGKIGAMAVFSAVLDAPSKSDAWGWLGDQ